MEHQISIEEYFQDLVISCSELPTGVKWASCTLASHKTLDFYVQVNGLRACLLQSNIHNRKLYNMNHKSPCLQITVA